MDRVDIDIIVVAVDGGQKLLLLFIAWRMLRVRARVPPLTRVQGIITSIDQYWGLLV